MHFCFMLSTSDVIMYVRFSAMCNADVTLTHYTFYFMNTRDDNTTPTNRNRLSHEENRPKNEMKQNKYQHAGVTDLFPLEWGPVRREEVISAPTASPLYIPQSPTSAPGTPTGQAPKIPPVATVKSVPAPAPAFVPAPAPAFSPAPAPAPIPAPLPTLQPSTVSSQAVPFPQPFSVFLAKYQPPMRTVASPVYVY
ncbi:hypothetical protein C0J52_10103 [Blattella germanica]|nr:hypothetical protein C0J52_10103 [Blattella germanica]